jgi:vancomycin resistance protein VanJ
MSDSGHRRYRIAGHPAAADPAPRTPIVRRGTPRPTVVATCWAYAAATTGLWGLSMWSPVEAWPVHLLLYGPRWLVALPAFILAPWAAIRRSRRSAAALAAAAVGFVAFWGPVLPHRFGPGPPGPGLRLLTCNVQFGDLVVADLAALIRETGPDLVLLQECGIADAGAVLGDGRWETRAEGEFLLASRLPILGFEALRRPDKAYRPVAIRAELSWAGGPISVVSTHLMTPRAGLEAIIHNPAGGFGVFRDVASTQRAESALLRRWVEDTPGPLLVAGDFNLTPEHPLYRRDWSGFANSFSAAGSGLGRTMHTRSIGLRIDHVLAGPGWEPTRCLVGPDVGSAHRPVVADLTWTGRPPGRAASSP